MTYLDIPLSAVITHLTLRVSQDSGQGEGDDQQLLSTLLVATQDVYTMTTARRQTHDNELITKCYSQLLPCFSDAKYPINNTTIEIVKVLYSTVTIIIIIVIIVNTTAAATTKTTTIIITRKKVFSK